ncbi:MAG: hypothetical protein ACRDXX_06230 [Stackebrandtia sp.]
MEDLMTAVEGHKCGAQAENATPAAVHSAGVEILVLALTGLGAAVTFPSFYMLFSGTLP